MKCLTIICSFNPTHVLLDCISSVKQYYPNFDIVVIDSDSTKTEIYQNVDVPVVYAQNKNYEYGAYKFGYNLYTR